MVYKKSLKSKNLKIVILGHEGQLGTELFKSLSLKYKTFGISKNYSTKSDNYLGNLYFTKKLIISLNDISPDIIINCAAFTKVQECETKKNYAKRVNGNSLKRISEYCLNNNIFLIHFSTDYVFSGAKNTEYKETDLPKPINEYGKSKLLGEKHIIKSGCNFIILRISWVFSFYKSNFVKKILYLSKSKKELKIICDQFGKPTSTYLVSKAIEKIISNELKNKFKIKEIYHLSCKGKTNWFNFAKEIINLYSNKENLNFILKKAYSTKKEGIKRPRNSALNTSKFEKKYNYTLPSWKEELRLVLKKIQYHEN